MLTNAADILKYEDAVIAINNIQDQNLKRSVACALSIIIMDERFIVPEAGSVDLLVIVQLLEKLLSKKHILEAFASGDWSELTWDI